MAHGVDCFLLNRLLRDSLLLYIFSGVLMDTGGPRILRGSDERRERNLSSRTLRLHLHALVHHRTDWNTAREQRQGILKPGKQVTRCANRWANT